MPSPKQRKIALVGSRSVGKSSLTVRFVDGLFVDSYYPTIENTFSKVIKHNDDDYAVEIVDMAGQDEYSILNSNHFIGIHGYMLVYSITSRQSFETIKSLHDKILNHLGTETAPMVVVGNKIDLRPDQRQVSEQEGINVASEFNCKFFEASARANTNVNEAFQTLLAVMERTPEPKPAGSKCNLM